MSAKKQLVYRVTEGWKPLCEFLELKDCPADRGEPMPWVNKGVNIMHMWLAMHTMRAIMLLAVVALLYKGLRGLGIVGGTKSKGD